MQAAKRSKRDTERQPADAESESSASRRGRKLWEEIHTVHYHRYNSSPAALAAMVILFIMPLQPSLGMPSKCSKACQSSE